MFRQKRKGEATITQIQTMRVQYSGGDNVSMLLRTDDNHLLSSADVKGQVQLFVERQKTVLYFFPPTINTV